MKLACRLMVVFPNGRTRGSGVPGLCQEEQAQGISPSRGVPSVEAPHRRGQAPRQVASSSAPAGGAHPFRACSFLGGAAPWGTTAGPACGGGATRGMSGTVRQRAHDDSVVMVKNEEIVASSVSALEYQTLMQSDGGKMGGAVTGCLQTPNPKPLIMNPKSLNLRPKTRNLSLGAFPPPSPCSQPFSDFHISADSSIQASGSGALNVRA